MFRSATFKLTVWYLAIVVAISLIFSAVIYHFAVAGVANGLEHQTVRIFREFPFFSGNPLVVNPRDTDLAAASHHILNELIAFNIVVFIFSGFASYWLARRTLEPIEAAHEQQKRFTADVSHELRTPLTSLRMSSEVALADKRTGKNELLQTLKSNLEDAATMELLINNLLRLTRLEDHEIQTTLTTQSTGPIAEQAVAQTQKLADTRHIKLSVDVPELPVFGDKDSLVQLLVILLDNAIKYSPQHSEVELAARANGERTEFIVRDHGKGIAKDALPHVFDRFYRADASRNKTTEGFGLGLSIAKLIADAHHGTILLTSRPNHGTTATVSLPSSNTDTHE